MPTLDIIVNDRQSDVALLWLLTFTDYDNKVVLRAVNNLQDVTSRGNVYTAFPFNVTLPPDDGQKPTTLHLTFPNVGRELMEMVRKYAPGKNPKIKMELIASHSLDRVEKTLDFLTVTDANFDAMSVTFTLGSSSIFGRKTCTGTYNQAEFPGLFWALKK